MATIGHKRCNGGHILGIMRSDETGRMFLELFRQAVDYGQDMPDQIDVVAIVHDGKAIRCSICGGVVEFHQARRARVAFE